MVSAGGLDRGGFSRIKGGGGVFVEGEEVFEAFAVAGEGLGAVETGQPSGKINLSLSVTRP